MLVIEKIIQEDLLNRLDILDDERKKKIIKTIITKEKWYMYIDIEMFISILYDLGIDKESAINLYKKLYVI